MYYVKCTLSWLAGGGATAYLAYLAVGPAGALYSHPLACLGVGLIGLGLIKICRESAAPRDS